MEGPIRFRLEPSGDIALADRVRSVLAGDHYTAIPWHDLPIPIWLVRDRERNTPFRVVVRETAIELHVLPRTEADGLETFYERLGADADWTVSQVD